jgi:hypothetical protein
VIPRFVRPVLQKFHARWSAHCQKPFPRLVRVFVGRVFHGSSESAEDELGLSMGLVFSLLALPGAFYSMLLMEKYSTLLQFIRGQRDFDRLAGALPDEYFFIALSVTVTGLVAVWQWDSIFPDRRDYSNLVPLPIPMRKIFLANLTAIVLLTVMLAIDVNAVSAVLFPLIVSASEEAFSFFLQFVWVHAFVVILASVFSFFAVFVIVGVLMLVLPYAAFRRISVYVRAAIAGAMVATLATSFAVPNMLTQLPQTLVRFLPPVWFLGLCQLIRGKASPPLAVLGRLALLGSEIVIVAAIVAYAFSYGRCFMRIPETAGTAPPLSRPRLAWIFPVLDRTILTSPFQRAGYRFVMKTLLRSERHGLVLGGFLGLGIVIASQFLFAAFSGKHIALPSSPSAEILAIPLIVSYCIILGVRFVFDIPLEMRANWVFRILTDKTRHQCIPLARKLMLTFVLPWVVSIVLPLYGYLWGWRVGILEAIVVTACSLGLIEILLLKFRKIPFTCSYPPFRDSAIMLAFLYVVGFFAFVVPSSNLAHWGLSYPIATALVVAAVTVSGYVISRTYQGTEEDIDKELIFEETAPVRFELLDLRGGI